MAQLCHWSVPCIICESHVEYHCNTCGDVLCSTCRDIHLKGNAGRNHDVVPYTERIEPNKPSLPCEDHPSQQCGVWCDACNRGVCGDCVTSPNHRGHHFLKFDEKIGERRKDIQRQFDRYSKILYDWQTSLTEAEKMKETYEKNVTELDKEIVDQADELCKQVRKVERERREQLQEMKGASLRVLQDRQKTLTDGVQRLKEKVKEIENILRSRDSSNLIQYTATEENIPETMPSIDAVPPFPDFTPGSSNILVLKNMLGSLSDKRVENIKPMPSQSKEETSVLANQYVESDISIERDYFTPAIASVGSGQTWVQTFYKKLQLMDRNGEVKRTVNIDFVVLDMAVTPKGIILLPDRNSTCIRSMSMKGKIKTLFNTQLIPHGICCLPSGEIVVTFRYDKRVILYSSSGKIIKRLDSSLFHYPWYVAHSQVNQQLYVCDKSDPSNLTASGKILAFHTNGELQYTYTGYDTGTFTPTSVCADPAGQVLITDYSNKRVHILDKGGNFIQYLLTEEQGLTEPVTIDVDSDGYAWIGKHYTGRVSVVKYR